MTRSTSLSGSSPTAGAVVVKFWVQIDKDTQLARFHGAAEHPGKAVEDHRGGLAEPGEVGRQYEEAVDEMLAKDQHGAGRRGISWSRWTSGMPGSRP